MRKSLNYLGVKMRRMRTASNKPYRTGRQRSRKFFPSGHSIFGSLASLLVDKVTMGDRRLALRSRRVTGGRRKTLVGLLSVFFLLFGSNGIASELIYDINIRAQNAADALERLAEQTGAIMLFPYELASKKQANSVVGRYALSEALDALLDNSGLAGDLTGERVVSITPVAAAERTDEEDPMVSKKKAFLVGLAAIFAGTGTHAQDADSQETEAEDSKVIEEIVVAGSRIRRSGYEAPTPITIVGQSEIDAAAPVNVADFINQLPSFAGSRTPSVSVASISPAGAGLNVLNLRGLGGNRTLVLLDGRRIPASTQDGLVDMNALPQALISSIEVVTGGASAAWGSDAISGVVNLTLDKEFTGMKGEAQIGSTTYGDDQNVKLALAGGTSFADDRGHLLLSASGNYREGVPFHTRDWYTGMKRLFNPDYTPTNGQPQILVRENVGFSTLAPGTIITEGPLRGTHFGANGQPLQLVYGPIVGDPHMVGGDWEYTDFANTGSLEPRIGHKSAFSRISYELGNNVEIYGEISYGSSDTHSICCSVYNFNNLTIQADNAFLPAQVASEMTIMGIDSVRVGSSNFDIGSARTDTTRTTRRYLLGASGEMDALGSNWRWEAYAQKGIGDTFISSNVPKRADYRQAIDAVYDTNGSIVCRSTLTNPGDGCVPLNILGIGVASQTALDYVIGTTSRHDTLEQDIFAATISGDPFDTRAGPVSVASGIEYRKESVKGQSDALSQVNSFWAGNFKPLTGSYDVVEGFFETVVPIATDMFDLNAAVRATDYSTSGYVTTWKMGGSGQSVRPYY